MCNSKHQFLLATFINVFKHFKRVLTYLNKSSAILSCLVCSASTWSEKTRNWTTNPFSPKGDQLPFSLFSLSPEIHLKVWRIWQQIVCSLHHSIICLNRWEHLLYELGLQTFTKLILTYIDFYYMAIFLHTTRRIGLSSNEKFDLKLLTNIHGIFSFHIQYTFLSLCQSFHEKSNKTRKFSKSPPFSNDTKMVAGVY